MFSRKAAFLAALLFAVSAAALQRNERVIAGSPGDSMEVRHLVLRGTNEEIGRALAEIAMERYSVRAERAADPLRTRAQRRYIETVHRRGFRVLGKVVSSQHSVVSSPPPQIQSSTFSPPARVRTGCASASAAGPTTSGGLG